MSKMKLIGSIEWLHILCSMFGNVPVMEVINNVDMLRCVLDNMVLTCNNYDKIVSVSQTLDMLILECDEYNSTPLLPIDKPCINVA
jgi:hypothetical protein